VAFAGRASLQQRKLSAAVVSVLLREHAVRQMRPDELASAGKADTSAPFDKTQAQAVLTRRAQRRS